MRLLIDMSLLPEWVPYFKPHGIDSVHWSSVGACDAPDSLIMQWAREHACIVFTHDLDFGILLAHSRHRQPSVIQARTQDVSPAQLGPVMVAALKAHAEAFATGALLTIDPLRLRVRILPISKIGDVADPHAR